MQKIPTLFTRTYTDHVVTDIRPELTSPSLQWVLDGEGDATEKFDGACCAIIDGEFYRRYDAKKNKHGVVKTPPRNSIPCCPPDPITGHWPHFAPVLEDDPSAMWYMAAFVNTLNAEGVVNEDGVRVLPDGTYEVIGPHFQGNPYGLSEDILVPHGQKKLDVPRSFEGIRDYLKKHPIEGIVFWRSGIPRCKIKRTDFGFEWPVIDATFSTK